MLFDHIGDGESQTIVGRSLTGVRWIIYKRKADAQRVYCLVSTPFPIVVAY